MVKNLPAMQETVSIPMSGKSPWRRAWQPTPVFLPGEFHGQRSLVGYSPWGHKELDTTTFSKTKLKEHFQLGVTIILFSSCGETSTNSKNPEALTSVFLFIYLFLLCQKEV